MSKEHGVRSFDYDPEGTHAAIVNAIALCLITSSTQIKDYSRSGSDWIEVDQRYSGLFEQGYQCNELNLSLDEYARCKWRTHTGDPTL